MWLRHALTRDPNRAGFEEVFQALVEETDRIRFHVFGILALYMRLVSELDPDDFTDDHFETDDLGTFAWTWNFLYSSLLGLKNKQIICFNAVMHAVSLAQRGQDCIALYADYPESLGRLKARRMMCSAASEYFRGLGPQPPIKYFNRHVGDMLAVEIQTVFNNYLKAGRARAERNK